MINCEQLIKQIKYSQVKELTEKQSDSLVKKYLNLLDKELRKGGFRLNKISLFNLIKDKNMIESL